MRLPVACLMIIALWGCRTHPPEAASAQAAASGAEEAPALKRYAPSATVPLIGLLPFMHRPVTSFGAASDERYLYTLGGYSGEPHVYSGAGQSPVLARLALDGLSDWEELARIDHGLQGLALIHYDDKVCRIGGTEARNAAGEPADMHSVPTVSCYALDTGGWSELPPLPNGRSSHEAAIVGRVLYVAGGWTLQGAPNTGEFRQYVLTLNLDALDEGWRAVAAPFKRRALGVASAANKLVVVGGLTPEGETSQRVDIFDPETQGWSQGPDFPDDAFGVAAVGVDDAVLASGASGVLYRLTPGATQWQRVTRLSFGRFFHQLVRSGESEVVALGGISGMHNQGRTAHVERVALGASGPRVVAWSMAYPGSAKNRQGVFAHDDDIYLFGGNNSLEQHDFAPDNFVAEAFRLHVPSLDLADVEPFPARRQTMQTLSRERYGIALGGFGHDGEKAVSYADGYVFDFENEHWKLTTRLPESRTQFGLADHAGEVWVFGGLNYDPTREGEAAFEHVTRVLRAKVPEDTVFQPSEVSLPGPRRAFAGAVLGNRYYMLGGMRGGFELVDDCLRFDFEAKSFEELACPEAPRLSGALVPLKQRLYLAGGSIATPQGMVPAEQLVELDPEKGQYTTLLEALPFDTHHMHAVAFRGRLLLLSTQNDAGRMDVAVIDPRPQGP